MSNRRSFTPSFLDDFALRLSADYVKGQRSPTMVMTYRGNSTSIIVNLNDEAKNRINVRLDVRMAYQLLELLNVVLESQEPKTFKLQLDKSAGRPKPGEKWQPPVPNAWLFVGRDESSGRIFLAVSCANNEALRARFFFKSPRMFKVMNGDGTPFTDQADSELAARAYVKAYEHLLGTILVTNYTADWGGNSGGGQNQSNSSGSYGGGQSSGTSGGGDFPF